MELPELQRPEIDAFLNEILYEKPQIDSCIDPQIDSRIGTRNDPCIDPASTMLCNLEMTLVLTVKLSLVLTLNIHQRIDLRIVRQGPSCLLAPRRWPVFESTLVRALKLTFVLTPSSWQANGEPARQTNDMQ